CARDTSFTGRYDYW
nr:immunoglobulin heavy chain junction region [Macaca mulatta]MOX64356.1 immunoglobulin heavy chain junction region [Macaca mulatta]MOX66711.1 immunoglobulin heavy chain junction region [Macaca mulatta]MOX68204.1 immunoglobulin heavy chain junction region [Macaca mulatta]MOX68598.1 immunoglobulin heavy chain junction region [Macaca mulatta]